MLLGSEQALSAASQDDDHVTSSWPSLPEPDVLPPLPPADIAMPLVAELGLKPVPVHKASTVYGIDVSHYQGKINWQMVALDPNVQYVYIKCTESSGIVDECYYKNITEARKVGLPVGVYHFFSPSASAMMQLKNFLDNVDPRRHDLIPIVDVEKRGRGSATDFHGKLRDFLRGVEKAFGVKPIIYTGVNFYNEYLAGRYAGYRFMVARYGDEPPTLFDDVPIVAWQFTSSGYVSGIPTKVDRSCCLDQYSLNDLKINGQ